MRNNFCLFRIVYSEYVLFEFLRPLLLRRNGKGIETGINDKYIGKRAKVIEDVSQDNGVISIYDERWSARTEDGSTIPAGTEVIIVKNDSLIMYVRKQA